MIAKQIEKWENVKQTHSGRFRHICAYSGIFYHIQTYADIISHLQHIQELFRSIFRNYSEPYSVTLAYLKLWYIQNLGIFKTRGIFRTIFETLAHSEPETYSESWAILEYSKPEAT